MDFVPGIGFWEIVLIATIAFLVVGPKDLPLMMRKAGQMLAKVRAMASDFRASFDEMARQAELEELRKEVEALRQETQRPIIPPYGDPSRPFTPGYTPPPPDLVTAKPSSVPEDNISPTDTLSATAETPSAPAAPETAVRP